MINIFKILKYIHPMKALTLITHLFYLIYNRLLSKNAYFIFYFCLAFKISFTVSFLGYSFLALSMSHNFIKWFFFFFFLVLLFIYLFFLVQFYFIFKLYNIVLVLPNIEMNQTQVYLCSPSWTLFPPPSPYPPSESSKCNSPKHPVLCIEPGLVTRFIHDIIQVSMPFSQISPPSPSPTESIRLIYTSVSLLLSRTQGYCYHLSKFHIYALVYCIGVFLSGLLHSV